MAKTRILELAKDLGVEVEKLLRAAQACGVQATGPTSLLDHEDCERLTQAVRKEQAVAEKQKSKTLTLNRPLLAGQARKISGESRARTVQVEVRRRRSVVPPQEPSKDKPKEVATPAAKKVTTAATALKTEEKKASGPRTTIRRGLTPAQIAAAKAPRSSIKQLEAAVQKEKEKRERASARPIRKPVVRRTPSVAVAPPPPPVTPEPSRKKEKQGYSKKRYSPAQKAARRYYDELRHAAPMTEEEEERMARLAGKARNKGKRKIQPGDVKFVVRDVEIPKTITVGDLANRMAVKGAEVVKKLLELGVTARVNDVIDAEVASLIVQEFGHRPKIIDDSAVEDVLIEEAEEDPTKLKPRPPVVVVMGHVDHGKTSILDALRKSSVTAKEAGGITQHIGAYMVKLKDGSRVVFIDTPGHEAFTSLRARGAKVTDVAVLVVAADDGVKPQTLEALDHARAAGVPIIVAINKIDKPEADPEKVKRQLSEHGLIPEEWGGDTIFVPVSAKTGEGLDELLEMLALQTEILELKANPDKRGRGVIIESRLDRGRGPVATVLVQSGTFKKGDIVVAGDVWGRVRAIVDENGVQHRTAGPSVPFELLGLQEVPEAGQEIVVVENEKQAKDIVNYRKAKAREMGLIEQKKVSLEDLFAKIEEGVKELPVLIKGDVSGSVDALATALTKVGGEKVRVKVIHKGVGGITESDVMLASASNAIILGFNVRPDAKAKQSAEREGVDIRYYKVIYDAIDDIKKAMAGMLAPESVEEVIGSAEVREVFQVPKVGSVAGCMVTEGRVTRHAHVRVIRDGVVIYEGKIASLRRFKEDVREVKSGYECGIGIEKFNDIKVGDVLEFFETREVEADIA